MVKVDLSGVKIPKTVGGVKVPKKLRKKGKKLIAKANSPEGREAIAAGLAIAGSVIAAKAQVKAAKAAARSAEDVAERMAAAGERAAAAGERASERIRAKVVRHPMAPIPPVPPVPPRAPGEPGIDPSQDPAAELSEAITRGIGAFQKFLDGMNRRG